VQFIPKVASFTVKMSSASGGLCPPDPPPGDQGGTGITSLSKSQYCARAPWSKILATPLVALKHCSIGFGIMDCCLIQANLPLFILAHMVDWGSLYGHHSHRS